MPKAISEVRFHEGVFFRGKMESHLSAKRDKVTISEDGIGIIAGLLRVPWSNVKQVTYDGDNK